MAKQVAEYDPNNLIGNVISVISDRTGVEPLVIAAKLALTYDSESRWPRIIYGRPCSGRSSMQSKTQSE